jgi:hypothetical protein
LSFDRFSEQIRKEIKIAVEYFYKILKEELFVVCAGGGASILLTNEEIKIIESGHKLENLILIVLHIMSLLGVEIVIEYSKILIKKAIDIVNKLKHYA